MAQDFYSWMKQNRLLNFLVFLFRRFEQFNISNAAAGLTLSTLTALVPTVMFLIYLFSTTPLFAQYSGKVLEYLTLLLDDNAFLSIKQYLTTIPQKIGNLTIIGVAILLISTAFLMAIIETTFNNIWQVNKSRPFFFRLIIYILILTIGPLSIAFISSWWNFQIKQTNFVEIFPIASNLSYSIISITLYTVILFLMFRIIPYRHVPLKDALIGAIFTALILTLIKKLFTLYTSNFNNYELIYGAFAAIPLFILYIYLLWFTLLSGAVLTACLSHFENNAFKKQKYSNNDFEDTLRILHQLSLASKKNKGFKIQNVRKSANMGYDDLGKLMDKLELLGYIKKDLFYWSLKMPADEIKLDKLFDQLVLPSQPTQSDAVGLELYSFIDPTFNQLNISLADFINTLNHDTASELSLKP